MPHGSPITDPILTSQGLLLVVLAGIAMALGALLIGKLLRRNVPHGVKGEAYECGEPAVGSSWVQFDLRFYVVALLFVIFDAEVALLYPWAVVFKDSGWSGLVDLLIFLGLIVVGFAFLWRFGYLDWIRSIRAQTDANASE
ncbi:MAG: NADH-quinone oxidoreductase subunit A [Planctomycetes bacterium]|nr:NADH-quinone oxidoreductase subunit A [Planctomycetota bacterium]